MKRRNQTKHNFRTISLSNNYRHRYLFFLLYCPWCILLERTVTSVAYRQFFWKGSGLLRGRKWISWHFLKDLHTEYFLQYAWNAKLCNIIHYRILFMVSCPLVAPTIVYATSSAPVVWDFPELGWLTLVIFDFSFMYAETNIWLCVPLKVVVLWYTSASSNQPLLIVCIWPMSLVHS